MPTKRLRLTWRHARLEIRHTPDYLTEGQDHIEIHVREPQLAPLPVTDTGYRSEFVAHKVIKAAGGASAYVRDWLDREAKTKAWDRLEFRWRQLSLELVVPEPKAQRTKSMPTRAARRKRQP